MELSDKIIQHLVALAGGLLRGERITVEPAAMAELWADVAAGQAYLKRTQMKDAPGAVEAKMMEDHA